jgi:hypothetical protein
LAKNHYTTLTMPNVKTTMRYPVSLFVEDRYWDDTLSCTYARHASTYLKFAHIGCLPDCRACNGQCLEIEGNIAQGNFSRCVTAMITRAILVPARPNQSDGFKWVCAACSNSASNGEDVQLLAPKPIDYEKTCQFTDHIVSAGHRREQKKFLAWLDETEPRYADTSLGLMLSFMGRVQSRRLNRNLSRTVAVAKKDVDLHKKRAQEHALSDTDEKTAKKKTARQGDVATAQKASAWRVPAEHFGE